MLSVQQSYSRLFRPWDLSDSKKTSELQTKGDPLTKEAQKKKRKIEESKRENRLRKIRGSFKKTDSIHQDATVSTTTEDGEDKKGDIPDAMLVKAEESPVASLSQCCDRLLSEPDDKKVKTDPQKTKISGPVPPALPDNYSTSFPPSMVPPSLYPAPYLPEYPADIAQALGVPPTDPLLLESLAQGYAMELEYARIIQQENEAKLLNARKQRPKKYKCPHCHVGFSNNGQLKGHVRIHTGERPYRCDEKNCGKSFTRNEELTRHKRIHSGVRPYPCQTCGKKFGRRDHLKKHTRTHFIQAERMLPVFVPLSAVPHMGFPYLYGY